MEGIPIIGNVAAGNPILAEENIEDYCELSPSFFKPNADYFAGSRRFNERLGDIRRGLIGGS